MYALILTMILTGYTRQGVSTSIETIGFNTYEQCLTARSSWLQDHNKVSLGNSYATVNLSAVCVKTGD